MTLLNSLSPSVALLLGLATDLLGKKTSLPRVSLLIIFGALIGPSMLDLVPAFFLENF